MISLADRGEMSVLDQERCWEAAQSRDTTVDGLFVIAVRTTRVYCRPSCPARRPLRQNVQFFETGDQAAAAGFRPCKRCRPRDAAPDRRPELLRAACDYLESGPDADVSLRTVSARLGVSAEYLRRLLKRTLGVTPRQYADARRVERLKGHLKDGASVTRALYDAGYPSSNRLYESAPAQLGMTPATYRRGGRGMSIRYGVVDCALGKLLVGATERGICAVQLGDGEEQLEISLRREYPAAALTRAGDGLDGRLQEIVGYLDGRRVRLDLAVDVQATAFQIRVWRALRDIAYGQRKSYSQVAREIGAPGAARAVANACAANPVALIVPCHRVVRNDGSPGGYGWGAERKQALLAMEAEKAGQ
ncbi:MAG: bifunctional DNA-binding transcriptional regulator/O6-methylguanine-DNA methyltransferase Ada [Dehalococcoidia bacterium]|nr:bifunctional DNA-binding transcriptional regulator/O6-methylguanine-DNA methyltransferase Ada [Dehalococcoidia bacterium]